MFTSQPMQGGKIIVRGNAKGRVGGQMVKGDIFVLGQVERMMPSYIYKGEEEVELDGKKQTFKSLDRRYGRTARKAEGRDYLRKNLCPIR